MSNRIAALIAIGAIMTISIWSLGCSAGTEDRSDGSGHGQQEDGHAGSAVWTYTGSKGAEYWGSLSPDYAVCTNGRMQSPIDIVDAFPAKGPDLIFNYKPSPLRIVNNGHTVQVNYGLRQCPDGRGQALRAPAIPFPCTKRARHRRLAQRRWRCISCMGTQTDLWRWLCDDAGGRT